MIIVNNLAADARWINRDKFRATGRWWRTRDRVFAARRTRRGVVASIEIAGWRFDWLPRPFMYSQYFFSWNIAAYKCLYLVLTPYLYDRLGLAYSDRGTTLTAIPQGVHRVPLSRKIRPLISIDHFITSRKCQKGRFVIWSSIWSSSKKFLFPTESSACYAPKIL